MGQEPALRRSINLPMLVLYGLGTTIGAGIYALTGEVAAEAGQFAPLAFLLAAVLAAFTALSFAELSARFPQAAGEALYVTRGLGIPRLGTLVGMLVVAAACVSSATIIHGFGGYLQTFVQFPPVVVVLGLTALLAACAAWGISQSVFIASLITLVELGGLLLILWVARGDLATFPVQWQDKPDIVDAQTLGGIAGAALLAFYAFLGFEDMVNVAEEVRQPERNLPLAIVITLGITSIIYALVATAAVTVVDPAEMGDNDAPLTLLYERAGGYRPEVISGIALLAIVNGALIQMIMASRVLYGLARRGALPATLGKVNPRRRTPTVATAVVAGLVGMLALTFGLDRLAEITSTITLGVFTLVNLALWRLKQRAPAPEDIWQAPAWIPIAGFVVSLGFVFYGVARLGGFHG